MKYMEPLKQVLYLGLRNFDEHQVCHLRIVICKLQISLFNENFYRCVKQPLE